MHPDFLTPLLGNSVGLIDDPVNIISAFLFIKPYMTSVEAALPGNMTVDLTLSGNRGRISV